MSIKEFRESKSMTQSQLAEAIGVGRSTVAMWEIGKSVPRTTLLPAVAKVLGVPINKLIQALYKEAS